MVRLGELAKGPGRIYLTGGSTAILFGWRETTVDVDLKLSPEPPGVFEAIARVKDDLDINVELASPDLFIPELPGWRERSRFIARHGEVDFLHYDFYSQALAKIERGHERDLSDANHMVREGLVANDKLLELFREIQPRLIEFPALDAHDFEAKVLGFIHS